MAKAELSEEAKRDAATNEYAICAQRLARVRPGDYRERRDAMMKLARAEGEMVKAFGRKDADARMLAMSVDAIRTVGAA